MNLNGFKNNQGYALLEAVFYVSLFAIFSIAIINSLAVMTKSFKEAAIYRDLAQGGVIMERISREVKNSKSIAAITGTNLKINTVDHDGANKTVEFSRSGSALRFLENDVFTDNLNSPNTLISSVSFTQINTNMGTAVKIFVSVSSERDPAGRTADFYDTVVLRGDY